MSTLAETSWLLEVPTARDLGVIRDAEHGPMVASTQIFMPYAARQYLSSLEFARDFSQKSPIALGTPAREHIEFNPQSSQLYFNVDGWARITAKSAGAKKRFCQLAAPFFPAHPWRDLLLEGLSENFAELASVFNRCRLSFTLRACGKSMENYMHFDPNDYTAIAYLRGNGTHHLRYNAATLKAMKKWPKDSAGVNHQLPMSYHRNLFASPQGSLSIWRGKSAGRPSLHGRTDLIHDLRLICITSMHDDNPGPARYGKISKKTLHDDSVNSRHYSAPGS